MICYSWVVSFLFLFDRSPPASASVDFVATVLSFQPMKTLTLEEALLTSESDRFDWILSFEQNEHESASYCLHSVPKTENPCHLLVDAATIATNRIP